MSWFDAHLVQILIVGGLALLAIEVWVLGFATFFLFFIGLAMIVTGGLINEALIPSTFLSAILSTALFTGLSALVLWKPLRNMQNQVEKKAVTSDMVGHTFTLSDAVSPTQPGHYRYSGIDWKLVSQASLPAGTRVTVREVQVGEFYIVAADDE